jgi:hypothetical protein
LGERRPDSAQLCIERAVMPVLDLLDGSPQSLQICRHTISIPTK